ncbi:MAG TPA: alanine racemase [Candidatus Saccharimonadales bacterium]|nr:alanine racemase [Candidatus Saccharimonadales bacterium]
MLNFIRKIIKPKYETLNWIEVDASKIIANFNYLQSWQREAEIFPVLKANAYGHGLKEVCEILNKTEAKMVVVDSYPEAQIAYRYFKGRVLILGEMPLDAYHYAKLKRTEFVVYNEKTLRYLSRFGGKAHIHLFVNSGMNREGIKDIRAFIDNNKKYLAKINLSGLCSHLASADSSSILNTIQEDIFMEALDTLRSAGYFPRWIHLGNSAAVFKTDNKFLTAFRPGLSFYGYSPFALEDSQNIRLQPALELFSRIVSLQDLQANESVSYNETYRAAQATKIASIPFGYFEGLDRRLSNKAEFLVLNKNPFWAQVAGRVCMNLTCLEIGNNEVKVGTPVKLIANDSDERNSIDNLADLMGTISYELLVKLQANIRRYIINNPKK